MNEGTYEHFNRMTRVQKESNDKRWYKDKLDGLDGLSFVGGGLFGDTSAGVTSMSEHKRMRVNYDLFNNRINKSDFDSVIAPFGREVGELPADFTNKDIISGKIKALLGMEMKRPFSWKVVAVNEEATTRREEEEFSRLKDYVYSNIMNPIRADIEKKYAEQQKGKPLTPDEQNQIQQQIDEELKTRTPEEVKKYMARDHQDPAEALAHQILEYLVQKQDIKMKFNKAWKHGLISGREIFWVGTVNGEPTLKVVNPLRFDYDKSPDLHYIEDGEWAAYELYMTPSEVMKHFGSELTEVEMDEIYEDFTHASSMPDSAFTFNQSDVDGDTGGDNHYGIRIMHGEFKSLKLIKFLKYRDPKTGEVQEDIVDESYVLNKEAGDISIVEEWIVAKYEGYRIGRDKYAFLREVPGQYKNLDNLYDCKLSYVGATFDDMNSRVTSLVDRMKYYQYFYNILMYRVELLTASDKGKQLLLNMNMVPRKSGISLEKWMHYLDSSKIGWMDPNEEGNRGNQDISTAAKEIDMSLSSDIKKYIELAEYIEKRCGESVGITKAIEGQISSSEAVSNTQVALVQSANILEPYFELHNIVKRNVLTALIETAKVAYAEFQPKYLSYVLDDMSRKMVDMDYELLENSDYGIFVSNSMKSHEALQLVQQLSHAALQNQKIELSDVIKIMRSESIQEAEELLVVAENDRIEREQAQNQSTLQANAQEAEKAREWEREKTATEHANNMEEIGYKGALDLQKQTILSMGFNEDKDLDKDGTPDVLEVAKFGVDAEIKNRKLNLEENKLDHQIQTDKVKERQKDQEIKIKQKQQNNKK
jgi:hypothetical protein